MRDAFTPFLSFSWTRTKHIRRREDRMTDKVQECSPENKILHASSRIESFTVALVRKFFKYAACFPSARRSFSSSWPQSNQCSWAGSAPARGNPEQRASSTQFLKFHGDHELRLFHRVDPSYLHFLLDAQARNSPEFRNYSKWHTSSNRDVYRLLHFEAKTELNPSEKVIETHCDDLRSSGSIFTIFSHHFLYREIAVHILTANWL